MNINEKGDTFDADVLREKERDFFCIYIYTLLPVCLFACLLPINVKTAKSIGPKFVWDLA